MAVLLVAQMGLSTEMLATAILMAAIVLIAARLLVARAVPRCASTASWAKPPPPA